MKSCKWLFFDIIFASINHKKEEKWNEKMVGLPFGKS